MNDATDTIASLLFSWAWPTIAKARKNGRLNADDLYRLDYSMSSQTVSSRLMDVAADSKGLWVPVLKMHSHLIILQIVLALVKSSVIFGPMLALRKILEGLESKRLSSGDDQTEIYIWGTVLVLSSTISVILETWDRWLGLGLITVTLKSQLNGIIFRKALAMEDSKQPQSMDAEDDEDESEDGDEDEEGNGGKSRHRNVTNLLNVDTDRVADICSELALLPCCVLESLIGVAFLVNVIGWKRSVVEELFRDDLY